MRKETNMSKKLKIQFWKAEKALCMQILKQEGLPQIKSNGNVNILARPRLGKDKIDLRGDEKYSYLCIESMCFSSNAERDAYLDKVVNAITDELFTGKGELKVGEMCEVRNINDEEWRESKLLAILPEQYHFRYILEKYMDSSEHISYAYARPIAKRIEPKIEECGQLITYTWEDW